MHVNIVVAALICMQTLFHSKNDGIWVVRRKRFHEILIFLNSDFLYRHVKCKIE